MPSPVEQMARGALEMARTRLDVYGSARSRKDFTQAQLMALLVLRLHWQTTYRALPGFLAGHRRMRKLLGMEKKIPHYTTLQKFGARAGMSKLAHELAATFAANQNPR